MGVHQQRLSRLRAKLDAAAVDQFLVTDLTNVLYVSGFTGTNATLIVDADQAVLMTDFRYLSQAAEQAPDFEIVDGAPKPIAKLAERLRGRVGIDDAHMTVAAHKRLAEGVSEQVELLPVAGVVEKLRAVKDAGEIKAIAAAADIADAIYERLVEGPLVGVTERELAWKIEMLAHELGAEGLSFPPIVASGAHGALPHAEPRSVAVEKDQLVVLDLGVKLDGYCSDATRTFATGKITDEARAVYDLVLKAQLAALDEAVAGRGGADVDSAARSIIDQAGHAGEFGHGTGHGVGLEVHEEPRVSQGSDDILEAGNVVTIEPGVYLEGRLGVRIEDLVVIEADGAARVLSGFTKDLVTVA